MIRTYNKYIVNPRVEKHAKIKGTPSDNKGRPSTRPAQLGHEVKTSGEFEYSLGYGRSTKATHIESARNICWRR
eukprot:9033488-Heterocapsa_arctica.AAC.1